MGESSIQLIGHPNGKIAQVHGVIDGTFDLRPLLGEHEIVLFDLDGVARITSFGVREWRTTLGQLHVQYLCFVRCHPSLVSQFNLVPGFACGGELISFYLPYICPKCNHVSETLLDLRTDSKTVETLDPPTVPCPACSADMEFDDIPAAYFKYARSVPPPNPPAAASAMIDDDDPDAVKRELSVKKDVEDTVTAFWLSGFLENKRSLRRLNEGIEGEVILELSDLDGISEDGMLGLVELLRAVGRTYVARVPGSIIPGLFERIQSEELDAKLLSVCLTLRCPGCGVDNTIGFDEPQFASFLDADNTPFKRCASCAHKLEPSEVSPTVLAAIDNAKLVDAPEAVRIYLENRRGTPGSLTPGDTRTYTRPSQLLFGNYRILRRLGQGGMGEILLARYVGVERFEKLVVIKRIRKDYLRNPNALQEFQREARVTARLSHPNIVQIFDFSKVNDEYFFALEYINGIDLRKALRVSRDNDMPWDPALCMRVISDVCAGLEAAHGHVNDDGKPVPIFHRDVSPENIIISVDGAVKLMDFGIAKAADSSEITESGIFKGKQAYSAPEHLEPGLVADHRSDIYATGIVLFEMLSLRRYLGDEPTLSALYEAATRPPKQLADVRDDIPDGLQPIFERATAADRTKRYQAAYEFRESLEKLMKQSEYPTTHDLAAWIRKIKALDHSSGDHLIQTPGLGDSSNPISAPDRQATSKQRRLTSAKAKASDDDG